MATNPLTQERPRKGKYLGSYKTAEEASQAYQKAAEELFGDFNWRI